MQDLFADNLLDVHPAMDVKPKGPPVLSVSALAARIKGVMEDTFGNVQVRGEISGCKRAASGHWYMDLKDDNDVIAAVCWRGTADRLTVKPEDGLEVICKGKITTYRSKYQLVINSLEPAGQGALLALLEARRKALAAEGLFDAERKQPLPLLPKTVGVVTSSTGAVLHDICHRIRERCPRNVLLAATVVQGAGAEVKIAAALNALIKQQPDVIIVARGGGSVEDLWCFNEEAVVRAIAECPIPIITAIGHETDTSLADLAADVRAPTPTGAAELAVPVKADWLYTIKQQGLRAERAVQENLQRQQQYVQQLGLRLPPAERLFEGRRQRLDELAERSRLLIQHRVQRQRQQLDGLGRLLESCSHHRVLQRGFVMAKSEDGKVISTKAAALQEKQFNVAFADGTVSVVPQTSSS